MIKKKISLTALLMSLNICLCQVVFAASNPASEQAETLVQQEMETERPHTRLHFRFFPENDQDRQLQDLLESSQALDKLESQFQQNFNLNTPIYFHIQHIKEAQLIEAEIEPSSQVVILPYSFLYTLHQGLSTKYDQQSEVIHQMFAATAEFYIWSELANIIIRQQELEIRGRTSTAQDNFATVMMLNQNNPAGEFLVDAAEAYLLIHSLLSSSNDEEVQNELESDQKRYKHILCLTIGFDHLTQTDETGQDHLAQFSLNMDQIDQCQHNYLEILKNWHQALMPLLKESNLLNYWLNQESLLNTEPGD